MPERPIARDDSVIEHQQPLELSREPRVSTPDGPEAPGAPDAPDARDAGDDGDDESHDPYQPL
ncbi:hypothetical protein FH608_038610 [Nonomuraea phyllanthi]|uniref:Uncharacterized protein n=1 Tax=Nonomuraea phyllanthi TaxID=2219224 RepID=A0A5C4VPB1_9ACTN|nr:hypothetical protein [Nonomuraea phyllanthi]KAB8189518.1 hypothetical protein FH608_038610 [Nonomuraea phyllanthi]QFY12129.1 hypothetical protein GBF35_41110 [Nonomuraea phyllanthi]